EVIDAGGQWIMPGLIDAHCHVSYGYPMIKGEGRRNLRVGIHSRGAGSTRAAAEAGVDWIIHADLAPDRDLEAVAKGGMPIIPTATFLAVVVELGQTVKAEQMQLDINRMKRHFDLLCELMHRRASSASSCWSAPTPATIRSRPMASCTPRNSRSSS